MDNSNYKGNINNRENCSEISKLPNEDAQTRKYISIKSRINIDNYGNVYKV